MTRIVGGRWRGRALQAPKGSATRPTAEKVRAAIANALAATGGLAGARVLDLYAGSGALGLELASRGAAEVVLVERDRAAQRAIRENISTLDAHGCTLVPVDVTAFARLPGPPFDIVVADPPYAQPAATLAAVLTDLHQSDRLVPGADLVIERSARDGEMAWPEPMIAGKVRRFGDTVVCYGRGPAEP